MTSETQRLEQEVEESRARLDVVLTRLSDKMTVTGLVDEAVGMVRPGGRVDGQPSFTLASFAARHPLALLGAAIGIGLLAQKVLRKDGRPLADDGLGTVRYDGGEPYLGEPIDEAPMPRARPTPSL